MRMPEKTQQENDPSRQKDVDGSVRPAEDNGFRFRPRKDLQGSHGK